MFIREYALEEYWLNKRIELLHLFDDIAQELYHNGDDAVADDDPRIIMLQKHYADVINPVDVEKRLKSIYSKSLYSPIVSKRKRK
jgi:hypothetical protein